MTDNAIGPGSMLLCVDDRPFFDDRFYTVTDLTDGRVYECIEVARHVFGLCARDGCGELGVVVSNGTDVTKCLNRFIPAGRRGDFSLLLNIEKTVKEEA